MLCDDAVMRQRVGTVNLGHNQGDIGFEPEGRAVVDIDGTALFNRRGEAAAHVVLDGTEDIVQARKGLVGCLLNNQLLPLKGHLPAGAAGAGEQTQLADRDVILLKNLSHLAADGARRPENTDFAAFHFFYPPIFTLNFKL